MLIQTHSGRTVSCVVTWMPKMQLESERGRVFNRWLTVTTVPQCTKQGVAETVVDRPTQLICISDMSTLKQTHIKDIGGQSATTTF